jgi:RimJ/RimL family protein N-acetyltransferase
MNNFIVTEGYAKIYNDLIRLNVGDLVSIEKWETNPEWLGWVFCVDQNGVKGWVSEKYLEINGNSAKVIRSYDASELDVAKGELVKVHFEEFGWAWAENSKGQQGWVPLKNLDVLKNISFVTIEDQHISILRKWLKEPHVAEFWQETDNEEELREKFLRKLQTRGVSPFIILLNSEPIGFIQSYEACHVGDGWWPGVKPEVFGVDQFIGEATLINKGLGTKIIYDFCALLFKSTGVNEIITDPDPKNGRAIRAYEKAGFTRVTEIKTPGGEAL